jgi:hypothetical protein
MDVQHRVPLELLNSGYGYTSAMNAIGRTPRLPGRHFAAIITAVLIFFVSLPLPAQDERLSPARHASKAYTVELKSAQHKQYCQASASIEYSQYDDVARVSGQITKNGCTKAGGDYTVAVRFRDANGDVHNLEFEELWTSSSELPVLFSAEYEIGKNVDLVRVRTKRLECVCAELEGQNEEKVQDQQQE